MRRRFFAAALGPGLITILLVGCASQDNNRSGDDDQAAIREFHEADAQDDVAGATQAHADQLSAALARTAGGEPQWTMPEGTGSRRVAAPADETPAPEPTSLTLAQVLGRWLETMPAPEATSSPAEALSRRELFEKLIQELHHDEREPLDRALVGVLLSVADGGGQLDAQLLAGLDPAQQHTVRQYHHVMQLMRSELSRGEDALARESLQQQLMQMFGEMPITIRRLKLCRQVTGYGNYQPFESHRFLAGRPQRMIVYVELDHFHVQDLANGQHQVKLEQQVVLYNESDGLAVWRHDPVQIIDTSRNRRRDFFVVQLITLPERLSVGQYRLKVRVTDRHGGAIDEATTRIEFVADEKLLNEGADG